LEGFKKTVLKTHYDKEPSIRYCLHRGKMVTAVSCGEVEIHTDYGFIEDLAGVLG
jgi:hypothetical protein